MLVNYLLLSAFILSFVLPVGIYLISKKKEKNSTKLALLTNLFLFVTTLCIGYIVTFSGYAHAETTEAVASNSDGLKFIAAALSTGLSCVGAGIAVSNSASAALGALSEDQSIFGKSLIFVALAEGVAIYGLVISVMILNK